MLTKKQINDVCLVGRDSKTCRYLGENNNNYYCLKKTFKKQAIDHEVKDFFNFCEKRKIDADKLHLPTSDNCEGTSDNCEGTSDNCEGTSDNCEGTSDNCEGFHLK